MFTVVPSENRTRALCSGTKCEYNIAHDLEGIFHGAHRYSFHQRDQNPEGLPTRLICFKNYLFLIITEYEFAVVTRKKDLLPFALGQRTADTKRTLKGSRGSRGENIVKDPLLI